MIRNLTDKVEMWNVEPGIKGIMRGALELHYGNCRIIDFGASNKTVESASVFEACSIINKTALPWTF